MGKISLQCYWWLPGTVVEDIIDKMLAMCTYLGLPKITPLQRYSGVMGASAPCYDYNDREGHACCTCLGLKWSLVHLSKVGKLHIGLHAYTILAGLYSRSAWVKQGTTICLWASGKTCFYSYQLRCWAPRISWLGTFGLLIIFLRPQPWL